MHSRIEGHIAIVEHPKTPAKGSTQSSTGWRPACPAKTPSEEEDFTGTATIQVMQCELLARGGVSECKEMCGRVRREMCEQGTR